MEVEVEVVEVEVEVEVVVKEEKVEGEVEEVHNLVEEDGSQAFFPQYSTLATLQFLIHLHSRFC